MTLTNRLGGIKKEFSKIAFIGPNPYLFLQHLPKSYQIKDFYFCEGNEASVEKSYEIITKSLESGGLYERLGTNVPDAIHPIVIDEEKDWREKFEENQFDLIVNNMTLHWVNEIETTLRNYHHTLEPDGVFMSSSFGG